MLQPTAILITGGSSGIGEALALAYAKPGVFLALTGRDSARLAGVADRCRAQGAAVETMTIDVADRAAMAEMIAALDDRHPLDLVIANAGIGAPDGSLEHFDDQLRAVHAVNVTGVFNTVNPLLPRMAARRRGQVAVISSVAGYRGLPSAVAYSSAKAAVKSFGEGLRGMMRPHGIDVSVVNPGFVKSRMTARNRFRMPFLMDAPEAAAIICAGLARNRGRITFPWPMAITAWFMTALPDRLADRLLGRMPKKA